MFSNLHRFSFALLALLLVGGCEVLPSQVPSANDRPGLVLTNLMTSELEGVDDTEVVVSHVTIPPHTSLSKHWHPGEEFAYVLEGSVTLWRQGKPDIVGRVGDVVKVPLKQIHTAITHEDGVKLLVFRVHEQGQPERVPVP